MSRRNLQPFAPDQRRKVRRDSKRRYRNVMLSDDLPQANSPPGKTTLVTRRLAHNPELQVKLAQLQIPLQPFYEVRMGCIHPEFPSNFLGFWLLTEAQLDSLACFYHQATPCLWSELYPCPITWVYDLPIEEKRRRFGKFIGLRGCATPVMLKSEEDILDEARRAARSDELLERKWH